MSAEFPLGRRLSVDPDDHKFLMRRKLAAPGTALPTRKTWAIGGKSLDQGATSSCVGHAWRNFLRCAPVRTEKTGPSQWDVYRYAVLHDEWTGNDNEAEFPDGDPRMDDGTSVRAGAGALIHAKMLGTYLWAFDLQSVIEWALTKGPVVLGTNWYDSMFDPDSKGLVKITPTANLAGGHAYLLRGVDRKHGLATCENSWGDQWGRNGGFDISFADLERLIHENGEACTAIEQKLSPTNPKLIPGKKP